MSRKLTFLAFLVFMFVEYSSFAQGQNIIYDGRFNFTWEFKNSSGLSDTARISRPAKTGRFRNKFTVYKNDIKEGDRIIAIDGTPYLRSEKDSSENPYLEAGPASRTFEFEVYRKSMDSVLQIPVTKGTDITRIFPIGYVDYLADSSRNLTLHDILRDSVQALFVKNREFKEMIYSSSYGPECIWFRINIESRLSCDQTYLLVFSGSGTDTITTYLQNPTGEYITQYAGMAFPEDLRGYVYKDWPAVKLNLLNRGMVTMYVRVCTDNLTNLRYSYFQSLEYLRENESKVRTIFSVLGGMLLLIMVLCLLIFIVTRARSYLLFFLFVAGYGILIIVRSRYLGELDHTFPYTISRDFYDLIAILPVLFFLIFGINHLDIRTKYENWYKVIIATLALMVFSAFMITAGDLIYSDPHNTKFLPVISVINDITGNYLAYIVLVVPSLRRIRRRDNRGWYILLAILFFIFLRIVQDYYYPGIPAKRLVFGMNSIDPKIILMNSAESAGIILMFLIFAIRPYRS